MTKKPPHVLLTAALQYAALGLLVVPVHSIKNDGWCSCKEGKSCTSPSKHPRTPHGIRDATSDEANIGIATGPSGPTHFINRIGRALAKKMPGRVRARTRQKEFQHETFKKTHDHAQRSRITPV